MLKNKSKIFFAALFVTIGLFVSTAALAQTDQEKNNCDTFQGYLGPLAAGLPKFCSATAILTWAINRLLVFAGTVTVLFLIVGGFFYVTAAGNEEQSEKGKKILVNSAIGLVIILMSATIVRIVAGTLTSSTGGANSGAGSQTQNPNTGAPGGGNSGTGTIQFTGQSQVSAGSDYQFGAVIPSSVISGYCGNSGNPAFYSTLEEKNGNIITLASTGGDSSNNQTTVNFDAGKPTDYGYDASVSGQTLPIKIFVCGQQALKQSVLITSVLGSGSSSSTEYSDSQVSNAVSQSYFTFTKSGSGAIINVTLTNVNQQIICSRSTAQNIELFYQGNSVSTQPLTVRQFSLNSAPNAAQASDFSVKVCGTGISAH